MDIREIREEIVNDLKFRGSYVTLNGSAGTGKTTLVKEIVNDLHSVRDRVDLCATTHEACRVLSEKTGMEVSTIHSRLRLKLKIHPKGDFLYQDGNPPKHRITIIDEASMIGEELYKFITAEPTNSYLFVGDDKQLPPVGEGKSLIFQHPTYTLTKIWRQGEGNDNIDLSLDLDRIDDEVDGNYYKYITKHDVPRILDYGGTYLAWTNQSVINVNEGYRKYLGYKDRYEIGETIIAQNNSFAKKGDYAAGSLKNGQRIKIESIDEDYSRFFNLHYYIINGKYKTPKNDNEFLKACSIFK